MDGLCATDIWTLRRVSLREGREYPSPLRDSELPTTYRDSCRGGVISLLTTAILLLSTACGPRGAADVSTLTPTELPPTPTSEPTATLIPSYDDPYEPNDSMIQASGPLIPGQEYQAFVSDKSDVDFFYLEIEVPQTVNIALTDIPAGADYDLYLVTGEEDVLSSSSSSGEEDEYIEYTTSSVGIFYILILPFHNFTETEPYTLLLDLAPAPTPSGADTYEPNDTFEQAAGPLAFDQPYQAYIWDEGDIDNYLLQVDNGAVIAVDLTDIPTVGDYDLFLYNEAGELLAKSDKRTAREHIEQYLAPGRYYASVRTFAGFSRNEPYTLQAVIVGR
jgi:hypothetical protein